MHDAFGLLTEIRLSDVKRIVEALLRLVPTIRRQAVHKRIEIAANVFTGLSIKQVDEVVW